MYEIRLKYILTEFVIAMILLTCKRRVQNDPFFWHSLAQDLEVLIFSPIVQQWQYIAGIIVLYVGSANFIKV